MPFAQMQEVRMVKRKLRMKQLKFSDPLPDLILNGQKDITWRINDDKDIISGDQLSLCYRNGKEFSKAKVFWIRETIFANLTDKEKTGHEKFSSENEMYQTYSKYYNLKVGPKTAVKVIKYMLV